MSFTDYIFFPLLFLFFILYFITPLKLRWMTLLVASILFFCTWGIELLPFALGAVVVSWVAARWIDGKYEKMDRQLQDAEGLDSRQKQAVRQKVKKQCRYMIWMCFFLVGGVLIYTKAQRNITDIPILSELVWFGSKVYQHIGKLFLRIPLLRIFVQDTEAVMRNDGFSFFVPLGISYYTMSLIGYVADVYWRKEKAEKNICKLLLFALYFPKIFEGPISKHKNIAQQLNEGHRFDYEKFCFGLQRMLWGYFKKLVIADRLALAVVPVFEEYQLYRGSTLLVVAIFGAFQLYCDFSGCMDIVLGISEAIGITMEENFNRPFFSKSASEFWRRWHITLGTWFKDYVYMPIVISPKLMKISGAVRKKFGKRAGKTVVSVVPLAIVWLLTGAWHGTGWNYIVWGVYWGLLIIASTVFEPEIKKASKAFHINTDSIEFQYFRQIRTFMLFVISRIITIPGNLRVTCDIFKAILSDFGPWELVDGTLYTLGMDRPNFILAIIALILLWTVSKKQEAGVHLRIAIAQKPIVLRWVIYIGAIFAVIIFGVYGAGYDASSFVYMNY